MGEVITVVIAVRMFTKRVHVDRQQYTAGIRYVLDQKLHHHAQLIVERVLLKHVEIISVEAVKQQHLVQPIVRHVVKGLYHHQGVIVVV